jgi:hypothetical protein
VALALMSDAAFDPAAEAVLVGSGPEGALLSQHRGFVPGQGFARVTHYAPEQVVIEVDAEAPGYLVLTDAWYPGWEATVDGEAVEIQRADILFRAVAVGAGRHRVVFTFRPASLRVGVAISLVGLVGLVIVAAQALTLSKAERGVIISAVVGDIGDNSQGGK